MHTTSKLFFLWRSSLLGNNHRRVMVSMNQLKLFSAVDHSTPHMGILAKAL